MKKTTWTDYIKNMENAKSPKVPEHIWENVKPHLPQPNKGNRRFLWLFLPLLLVSSGIVSHYLWNENTSTATKQNFQNNLTTQESKTHISSSAENSNIDLSVKSSESATTHSSNLADNSTNRSEINKSTFQKSENRKDKNYKASSSIVADKTINSNMDQFENTTTTIVVKNQTTFLLENLNKLQLQNLEFQSNNKLNIPKLGDCYDFKGSSKAKFSVEIYAGPQYSPFSFKAFGEEYRPIQVQREETESPRASFLVGIRSGLSIQNWHLKAGLEYQNIYYQLNYENASDTIITRILNGGVIRNDTVFGKRIIKNHNFHRLLSVPISIGYQHKIREHALQLSGGVSVNLFMKSQGAVLNQAFRPVRFNDSLNIYRPSVGVSPFINLQWSGPIMHNIRYFVEPQFQWNQSFTKSNYALQHKFTSWQLKLGLQYLFQ